MRRGRFRKRGAPLTSPLHSDIFRSAKLRLATQKMIYVPGGRTPGPLPGSKGRRPSTNRPMTDDGWRDGRKGSLAVRAGSGAAGFRSASSGSSPTSPKQASIGKAWRPGDGRENLKPKPPARGPKQGSRS